MQNAPLGEFCNIFDLHQVIIGLENQFLVFLRVAVLHRFTIIRKKDLYGQEIHVQIQRGIGIRTPLLKIHKAIGIHSNTGPGHLENHKATKPALNVGPSSACQRTTI